MLQAKNISVEIRGRKLLDSVTFSIVPGEVVAVIGANGAGKSTLLKAMCGDIRLAEGQIVMDDKPLDEWKYGERARRRAVLPQHSTLSFPFTAFEVVLMGRTPHVRHEETAHDNEIAQKSLIAVDAGHLSTRMYPTLSGGEQQRIHLARAIAQIWEPVDELPRYLLLDEPTAALDLAHQQLTLNLARKLAHKGVGVLVILHDLNLAAQYADRLLLLKAGRILTYGTPDEVLTTDYIKNGYGVEVLVVPHPAQACPLIVTQPAVQRVGE